MQFVFLITIVALALLAVAADKLSNKVLGAKYLADKATQPGVIALKSGMLVEIIKSGDNANAKSPNAKDACEVTYSGTLMDGKKFDAGTTSFAPNQVSV